ncbi:MAG: glycoside hydrolase family 32 protein [Bacteroidales bacterium]|nr:glycoside hydrolase family 32 protein [Bacteroidales bacterium]
MNKRILVFLILSVFSFAPALHAQYNPNGDYRETFRGQFHFSPKSGWMNDINGLVYQGGKYHMIYQWGLNIRHGGYATSEDLIHWTDRGVALIPQSSDLPADAVRNVSGQHVFSGSAAVVSGKTAKGITGSSKEAIVAVYTGTGVGTCLAWSNDCGETWHDFPGNPVANPTTGADPRDPCVFFHKPTDKWILAVYENGTTFYASDDLIHWEFQSNIGFGFECPDMFELPLDGDRKNMKWVLMDANGSYLVGDFDGHSFTPSGQETMVMTLGPDFYAAQTFPTGGLPGNDDRKIQIGWMDHWNGGLGETKWMRNATFPVSLGLVTYEGKMRLTRTPIDEISILYKDSRSWGAESVPAGKNILEGVNSKTFELSADIDVNGTEASSFGFQIANKRVMYHKKSQVLLDEHLKPDADGHLRIRILVDWGQLEVFAAGGVFSYSEQFAFSPDGPGSVSFIADGSVKLCSMEFHQLDRIWDF